MRELVPLRVVIGLTTSDGKLVHDYPNFNRLDSSLRDGCDWSVFVDKHGGWHYDKVAGHSDHDPDNGSPNGEWLGMLLVPEDFAKAAVARFPEKCSILRNAEAKQFYNERCAVKQPEFHEDVQVLQAMAAKKALGMLDEADGQFVAAMDVDNPSPGRRRNKKKTWDGLLESCGYTIKE